MKWLISHTLQLFDVPDSSISKQIFDIYQYLPVSNPHFYEMKSLILVGTLTIIALSFFNGADGANCLENLPTFKKFGDERTACVKSLKLKEAEVVEVQNLKEKHFNDECLSNCTLENLKFFHNGTLQKDKMLAQLKSEASDEVYTKLAEAVETCSQPPKFRPTSPKPSDSTTKDKKNKDGKKRGCTCKKAARFTYCMVEKTQNC